MADQTGFLVSLKLFRRIPVNKLVRTIVFLLVVRIVAHQWTFLLGHLENPSKIRRSRALWRRRAPMASHLLLRLVALPVTIVSYSISRTSFVIRTGALAINVSSTPLFPIYLAIQRHWRFSSWYLAICGLKAILKKAVTVREAYKLRSAQIRTGSG